MPTATGTRRKTGSSKSRSKTSNRTKGSTRRSARSQPASRSRSPSKSRGGSSARSRGTQPRGMSRSRQGSAATRASSAPRSKRSAQQARGSGAAQRSRSSQSRTTTDIEEIRRWVEERGGTPATVSGTERGSEAAGLLRIDFPGYSGEGTLQAIDWDEFEQKFEEANLAFLYDTDSGSKFCKFVSRSSSKGNSRNRS